MTSSEEITQPQENFWPPDMIPHPCVPGEELPSGKREPVLG